MDSFTFSVPPKADKKKLEALIAAQLIYETDATKPGCSLSILSTHWRAALAVSLVVDRFFSKYAGVPPLPVESLWLLPRSL